MDQEMDKEPENMPEEKKWSVKSKLVMIVLVVALLFASYGYYWYSDITQRGKEAQVALNENVFLKADLEGYAELRGEVLSERNRCQEFISQSVGDFGSFEYCKKFIDWAGGKLPSQQLPQ
jgi:hypothetical protein